MYLHEMPVGSTVVLNVKVAKQMMNFTTHIIDAGIATKNGGYAICNLIKVDGKILNLCHCAINACIKHVDTGRDYKYTISKVAIDRKRRVLRLYSSTKVKPQNYRNAFRVPCGYRTSMHIGNNRRPINGFVHDISYSGVACIFTSNLASVNVNDRLSATIYDNDMRAYKAFGTIVRVVDDFKPDFTLVGVKFDKFDKDIDFQKLISTLQLKELRIRQDNK